MSDLDPISLEIFSNALRSITDETFIAVMKASYSTNIKERHDHSTAIMDASGRLIAQAENSLPIHVASMEGLIVADLKEDFIAAERILVDDGALAEAGARVAGLLRDAQAWLAEQQAGEPRLNLAADMRYKGQNFELTVALAEGEAGAMAMPSAAEIRQKFFDAHDLAYGFHNPHDDVEMVAIRLTARSSMYQEPPLSLIHI